MKTPGDRGPLLAAPGLALDDGGQDQRLRAGGERQVGRRGARQSSASAWSIAWSARRTTAARVSPHW
jgi:hypothetical protein